MIVFVQPFGLHSPGGGPRILRALLQDAPEPFLSVCTSPEAPPTSQVGPEVHLPTRPYFGRVESTRFWKYLYAFERARATRFCRALEALCREQRVRSLHALAHGMDFWYTYQVARSCRIPYYLSVHDDVAYTLQGRPDARDVLSRIGEAWNGATERFVICDAMGREYCRRYGERPYRIVTDGLQEVPARPLARPSDSLRVYFMGLLHLCYTANLRALAEALKIVQTERADLTVSMVCRCGGVPDDVKQAGFPVEELPFGTEADVAQDMRRASLLYLPLPFAPRYELFVRFSLSTKMITYLGSGLPILYHGPADSAAGRLLAERRAAVVASTLEPRCLAEALLGALASRTCVVENALSLARDQFRLETQRQRFWDAFCPS